MSDIKGVWRDKTYGDVELSSCKHVTRRMPIRCSVTDERADTDKFLDQIVWNSDTGVLQLGPLVPLEELYETQHNDAIGNLWKTHNAEFSKFILDRIDENDSVLEFGGGSGKLSALIGDTCNWSILDINTDLLRGREDVEIIRGAAKDYKHLLRHTAFVHSHFLEHEYCPDEFLIKLANESPRGSKHIFSVPNLRVWLEKGHSNALFFEHNLFLEELLIDSFLGKAGFSIEDKHYFGEHSIFYSCVNTGKGKIVHYDRGEENWELYKLYLERIFAFGEKIKRADGPIYLYGAHIFSQEILMKVPSIRECPIIGILDNSPLKIGKRLYGFDYEVFHPSVVVNYNKITVALNGGAYNEEIEKDLLLYNPKCEIITPSF